MNASYPVPDRNALQALRNLVQLYGLQAAEEERRKTNHSNDIVENPINVMKRYEMKYIVDQDQAAYFLKALEGHMQADRFGKTSIASLYYDTPDRRLINASIEKPDFKEKIRLRSYGLAADDSPVFLELKRKAFDIVYKRRIQSVIPEVDRFFKGEDGIFGEGQISRELQYFKNLYRDLQPACLIIYDRTAYFEPDGDLRLTIDNSPRYRTDAMELTRSMDGQLLLPKGQSILEVKVQDAMPLWLSKILDDAHIRKSSFSKYGEAYQREMIKKTNGGI